MILDLDTGIDDALALTYALASGVDVIGVTTTFGNVLSGKASENTLKLLEALHQDIKVYQGQDYPLYKDKPYVIEPICVVVHGENGIGQAELPEPTRTVEKMNACDFIIESALKYGPELTLVCEASLTNLALAIQKNRQAVEKIGQIVMMSGALTTQGNATIFAEANVECDAEAAKYVYESGIKVIAVPLDATLQTMLCTEDIESWKTLDNPIGKAIYTMTDYYSCNEYEDSKFCRLHDPLAVEVALNKDIIKQSIDINLTVDVEGITKGRTIGDSNKINDPVKTTTVVLETYSKEFVPRFVNTIKDYLNNI